MSYLELTDIRIEYDKGLPVLDGFQLAVEEGELVSLLGPSGCGKTTTLRTVAGFINPVAGHVTVAGKEITRLPPNRRDIGLVFQSYALFPHLTVFQNVAFGLQMRDSPKTRSSVASSMPWRWWTWPPTPNAARPSFPADSVSVWLWPAPSSSNRRCCSWTNRSAISTPSSAWAAHRDSPSATAPGHHHPLRHPRSGGSAHPLRPHRGHEQGKIEQIGPPEEISRRRAPPSWPTSWVSTIALRVN